MTDYILYMDGAGLNRKQMIASISSKYPRFGKATMTMICNPDGYGVELTPEAERKLIDDFGYHAGLATRKRRKPNRRKKNTLTVRLDDSLFEQLTAAYQRSAFCSMQDMLEAAIVEFINRRR